MKKLAITMLLGLTANAFGLQPKLQIDYTNHAWGYDNRGCLIDIEGNVYKYGYGHSSNGKGIVPSGKMSTADLKFADELIEKISQGKFTQGIAAADAGTTLWTATSEYGGLVKLKSSGDYEGKNSAPETDTLLTLVNGLCGE